MRFIPILLIIGLFAGCHSEKPSSEKASEMDSLSIPADIDIVVGIGKVEPEKGIVDLASETGGIVASVEKQAGDSVMKGEIIIRLQQTDASLNVAQLKKQIATQKQQIRSSRIDVGQYSAQLKNKIKTLDVSKKLAKTGAETRQNIATQKTEKKVLVVQLKKSKQAVSVSQSKLEELEIQLKSAENALKQKTIQAPFDGVLLSMDAKTGGAVQPLESFATLAPDGPMVVHGEADEMFANRLKKGQKVDIHYIGNNQIITSGKIIYLSADLSNKSLFTDVPGEEQDRRVRRFKVLLDSMDHLLINSKVECEIHLKNRRP